MNGIKIGLETIGCNLELPLCRFIDLLGEGKGVSRCAPSKVPREHQLRVALDCHEAIGIATQRVVSIVALLFATHLAPNLVTFHVFHRHLPDAAFK